MGYQKITFEEFKRELQRADPDKPIPFTWLTGAGMSVSAGIPLAKGISERIIIYEYLFIHGQPKPWAPDDPQPINYGLRDMNAFFDWYDQKTTEAKAAEAATTTEAEAVVVATEAEAEAVVATTEEEAVAAAVIAVAVAKAAKVAAAKAAEAVVAAEKAEAFLSLKDKAIDWFTNQEKFKGLSPEHPECYQTLFKEVFKNLTRQQEFLTGLIRRARGVNLAHLALAGILRDHPKHSHTVFTTNFDDLLLRALLSLNHNARVFGESKSTDRTDNDPMYPQIVHLHGKHTGYRLLNFDEQIELINPEMQVEFEKHVTESHLLIIGYSGWDDLAMKSLKKWQHSGEKMKGSIYWVPYRTEENMSDKVKDFLNDFPPNRVYVIENKKVEQQFDADSFVLSFCNFLNRKGGGFAPYRKGIIDFATTQHEFVFEQLELHPNFHPERAMELINEARKLYTNNQKEEAFKKKELAKSIAQSDDLPDLLYARVLQAIGLLDILMNNLYEAAEYLEEALLVWKRLESITPEAGKQRTINQVALAEICIIKGDFDNAKLNLSNVYHLCEKLKVESPIAQTSMKILWAYLSLLDGNVSKAEYNLKEAEETIDQIPEEDQRKVIANYSFQLANCFLYKKQFGMAEANFTKAAELFQLENYELGMANAKKRLADILIHNNKFLEAEENLIQCVKIYQDLNDEIGQANVCSSLGDLFYQKDELLKALEYYETASQVFRRKMLAYNLMNSLADSALIHRELEQTGALKAVIHEIKSLMENHKNPYAKYVLSTVFSINTEEEAEEEEVQEEENETDKNNQELISEEE